jgi:hypothetical protein
MSTTATKLFAILATLAGLLITSATRLEAKNFGQLGSGLKSSGSNHSLLHAATNKFAETKTSSDKGIINKLQANHPQLAKRAAVEKIQFPKLADKKLAVNSTGEHKLSLKEIAAIHAAGIARIKAQRAIWQARGYLQDRNNYDTNDDTDASSDDNANNADEGDNNTSDSNTADNSESDNSAVSENKSTPDSSAALANSDTDPNEKDYVAPADAPSFGN